MLESLDYLAFRNLIHRDVKPDNILYTPIATGEYLFQLADFGFANQHSLAKTTCGSPLYMAPEMFFGKGPQTSKMDVWSLFVTLISVTHTAGFNEKINSYPHMLNLLKSAAGLQKALRPMAREDPTLRASAAQMLKSEFEGHGLTTPSNRIVPIIDSDEHSSSFQTQEAQGYPPKRRTAIRTDLIQKQGNTNRVRRVQNKDVWRGDAAKVRIWNGCVRIPGAFPPTS